MNRDCLRFDKLLSPFMDSELPAEQMEAVRQHAAACPGCAARMQTLESLKKSVVGARKAQTQPASFAQGVLLRLRPQAGPRFPAASLRPLAAAAAFALLFLCAGLIPERVQTREISLPGLDMQEMCAQNFR